MSEEHPRESIIEQLLTEYRKAEGVVADCESEHKERVMAHPDISEAADKLDSAKTMLKALRKDIEIEALFVHGENGKRKFENGVSLRMTKRAFVDKEKAIPYVIERPELHHLLTLDEKGFAKLGEVMPAAEEFVTRSVTPVLEIKKPKND